MQDIVRDRDELCLLTNGGGCDRDLTAHANDSERHPELEPSIIIKLEDSPDVTYPWNSEETSSNLL